MVEYLSNPVFWVGLTQVIIVNILLSGDNAVVIALAARSLPPQQQKQAIIWGSVAAIVMRVILTIVAVKLLQLPYLKIIGGLLLFWIAVQLLVPENDDEDGVKSSSNLFIAIRTILIADLVMSLDNVIGVAAAAKGDDVLVIIGLAISIPLIIFGSTLLLKIMDRFPIIITIGAALLGWVAGEMIITDPSLVNWIATHIPWMHVELPLVGDISWGQILGAMIVIIIGKIMFIRNEQAGQVTPEDRKAAPGEAASPAASAAGIKVLVPIDGSPNSRRTVQMLIEKAQLYRQRPEIHLLNVQHAFPGTVRGVHDEAERFHQEEGNKALSAARELLDKAELGYSCHILVGDSGDVIAQFVKDKNIDEIVMGTRGANSITNMMLGSVSTKVLRLVEVPVLLVK